MLNVKERDGVAIVTDGNDEDDDVDDLTSSALENKNSSMSEKHILRPILEYTERGGANHPTYRPAGVSGR